MTIITFSLVIFIISLFAGVIGALTGLGGGVILIPALVLVFHVNMHYAMGASLIAVVATTSGTTVAYLREGFTNLRIGMFLEAGAVVGVFIGAYLMPWIPGNMLAIIFGLILIFSAYRSLKRKSDCESTFSSHPWAIKLKLESTYPTPTGSIFYKVAAAPLALIIMTIAGAISGLLGIGSGALKVLAMDQAMKLPYKVSTTTSNFIIGITAATGAGIYFTQGFIDPALTFPVMLGVLAGAMTGARILVIANSNRLRLIFSCVVVFLALQMIYKGVSGYL